MIAGSDIAERLSGDLTVADVRERAAALSGLTLGPGSVSVDCSAIERIDVAGLQLLVALARSAGLAGGEIVYANRSEALARALERAGLDL